MFAGLDAHIHVGQGVGVEHELNLGRFDVATVIDTPSVLRNMGRCLTPLVVESHTPYKENLGYLRHLDEYAPLEIVVPTQHQKTVVEEKLKVPLPISVVSNPLAAHFLGSVTDFEPPPPRPVLAWIGRLDYLKNWRGFLRICQRLAQTNGSFEVWIVGSFPHRDDWGELYHEARSLGLFRRFRWLQSFHYARMPKLLDAIRSSGGVVVSTSRGESFGMTIAEAMARACPVVVPQEPPFTELVEDGVSGVCYTQGDSASAVRALSQLLDDPYQRKRLGEEARTSVMARFSPEMTMPSLVSVLKRASNRKVLSELSL